MDEYNKLVDSLKLLAEPAIQIIVEEPTPEQKGSQLQSHFGGIPYFERGEKWPRANNGEPLDFVFQYFFDKNTDNHNIKLVQLYYSFKLSPWFSGSEGWLVKTYKQIDRNKMVQISCPNDDNRVSHCNITTKAISTLPDWEGTILWCNNLADLSEQIDPERPWQNYMKAAAQVVGNTDYRCQIGGYPQWVQGNDTPLCKNGNPMKLLFQLDSDDNAGIMWGDMGLLYIFYNPNTLEMSLILQSL